MADQLKNEPVNQDAPALAPLASEEPQPPLECKL